MMKKLLFVGLAIVLSVLAFTQYRANKDTSLSSQYGRLTLPPAPKGFNALEINAMMLGIHVSPRPNVPISPQDRKMLLLVLLQINAIIELPDEEDVFLSRNANVWTIFETNFPESKLSGCIETIDGIQVVSMKKFRNCVNDAYRRLF